MESEDYMDFHQTTSLCKVLLHIQIYYKNWQYFQFTQCLIEFHTGPIFGFTFQFLNLGVIN